MALKTTVGQRQKVQIDLAGQLTAARSQALQFVNQLRLTQTNLVNVPTTLKDYVEDIAADAQANPDNMALRVMQDTAMLLLAEADATSNYIAALIAANDSVKPL